MAISRLERGTAMLLAPACSTRHRGFTLIELIVVVSIIVILAGMAAPAAFKVHRMYLRVQCANNLEQIGQGISMYYDRKGYFPDATMLPSMAPETPSLRDLLNTYRFVDLDSPVWRCPGDDTYYAKEGLSYEYPGPRLAKLTLDDVQSRGSGRSPRRLSSIWLAYDFDSFHGPAGSDHSRNYLCADYHVE